MSNPIKQKAAIIKEMFGEKTDLVNRLSYANGVKNIVNVKKTNLSIRLRVSNFDVPAVVDGDGTTIEDAVKSKDRTIYLTPAHTVFGELHGKVFSYLGIPEGVLFHKGDDEDDFKIESLNRDQNLKAIATEMTVSPLQIIGVSMKSYNAARQGESSNYSNTITHYNISSLRPKRYVDLNLGDFQSSKDNNTDILKIDFIKGNFVAPVSVNDLLAFQVNANTTLDITFHLGARDSAPERFYREITAGTQLLNDSSWGALDTSCACD